MKQSQYVPVSSRFPYIFLSVLRRRDSVDPGGEKRIDWPSSEQLFDHVADVFVLWVEHQIHQIYYYTRSYQYKNLEQICTFAIILCNKERFEDVVLWSRSKVIAVPRALQNMIAWQSSTAAFTVDISKHLQINQITTPEIFHLDFQQERECLMRLTCVGLPKWTFYVYAARCRQMPPDAARCRQERLGKLLHLEEAAEDWADAAAVPVELVLSLGQARFGIQAADFW